MFIWNTQRAQFRMPMRCVEDANCVDVQPPDDWGNPTCETQLQNTDQLISPLLDPLILRSPFFTDLDQECETKGTPPSFRSLCLPPGRGLPSREAKVLKNLRLSVLKSPNGICIGHACFFKVPIFRLPKEGPADLSFKHLCGH